MRNKKYEINAFKRLAKKMKSEYPKLNILISGDALYASKPIIDICKQNGWKYIIRFKEGAIPSLYKEFETVVKEENESIKENYEFVTGLNYITNSRKKSRVKWKKVKNFSKYSSNYVK